MHQVFFLIRIYPYWAIPVAACLWQIAVHFHRRKRGAQYPFWIAIVLLVVTSVAWMGFRGDRNAETWIRWIQS